MDKRTSQDTNTIVECRMCSDTGLLRIDTEGGVCHDGDIYVTRQLCVECEHGKTFYTAHDPFHFKVVETFVINVPVGTWFELDEDGWVHNMRTTKDGIKFSCPLKTIKHLVTECTE